MGFKHFACAETIKSVKTGLFVCHIACVLPRLASGVAWTRLGTALLPQWNTFSFSNPIWTFTFPCVLVKCFYQNSAKLASGRSPYFFTFIYFCSNWSSRHAAPWHCCSLFLQGASGVWCSPRYTGKYVGKQSHILSLKREKDFGVLPKNISVKTLSPA